MGSSYWTYYLGLMLLTYVSHRPPLLVLAVVVYLLRDRLPDPVVFFRTLGRIGALKRQIEVNPANVTARRDLANIYLERHQPRAALKLVDEALARFPDDAELLFLRGHALTKMGRDEEALEPLVASIDKSSRVRFGMPYLVAGDALMRLGRWDAAIDAYARYLTMNSSSIEAHFKIHVAHARAGEQAESEKALAEAFSTWRIVPGYKKREQLGWWLRSCVARVVG
ncbi:MAG: tetratricopeptide repeat protein [Polyangiales bacterium]